MKNELGLSILLLSILGLSGPALADPPDGEEPLIPELEHADELAKTGAWKRAVRVWREAAEVASGKRGDYPFSESGKANLLDQLDRTRPKLDQLAEEGQLSADEADLLKLDIDVLVRGVQSKRPRELRMATCYKPMMYSPARSSLERLELRVPLLESLVEQDVLHPTAVLRVIDAIEADLVHLEGGAAGYDLHGEELERATAVAAQVRADIERLKARLAE